MRSLPATKRAAASRHVVDPRGDEATFALLAARLVRADVEPASVAWVDSVTGGGALLFPPTLDADDADARDQRLADRVRTTLGRAGHLAAHHTDDRRWPLLYRLVWRTVHERERGLLRDALDPDVRELTLLSKAVSRDLHKMKAFVRFRRIDDRDGDDNGVEGAGQERYVAWHRPDHRIVRLAAPFFAGRFGVMRWTIFTPHESVDWDGTELRYGAGVPASAVRVHDAVDDLWCAYYASIFNPARIKLSAMIKEMPRRHWATLPEATIIDELLREAPARVRRMVDADLSDAGAAAFVPAGDVALPVLREAAAGCVGCDLAELATQTVFGEGPVPAEIMLLGEQPGDEEDRVGRPFVGPAGRLLDDALERAGLDRGAIYLTNAVKHFKFTRRGKRRIHQRPSAVEVRACGPWLASEIERVNPRAIVLLGATAGQALLGAGYRVGPNRGRWFEHPSHRARLLATVHPSMILRTPETHRGAAFDALVADLQRVRCATALSCATAL